MFVCDWSDLSQWHHPSTLTACYNQLVSKRARLDASILSSGPGAAIFVTSSLRMREDGNRNVVCDLSEIVGSHKPVAAASSSTTALICSKTSLGNGVAGCGREQRGCPLRTGVSVSSDINPVEVVEVSSEELNLCLTRLSWGQSKVNFSRGVSYALASQWLSHFGPVIWIVENVSGYSVWWSGRDHDGLVWILSGISLEPLFIQIHLWWKVAWKRFVGTVLLNSSQTKNRKSLSIWGAKLLCSLVLWQQIPLYVLSDGSRVNRLWLGGWWLLVFSLHWYHWCSEDGTSDVLGGSSHPLWNLPGGLQVWAEGAKQQS